MSNTRILIVHGDPDHAERIRELLQQEKFDVPAAVRSLGDAVMMTEQYRPELVLLDVAENHALEALDNVRHLVSLFSTPVLCLAEREDAQYIEVSSPEEPVACLRKPFSDEDLVACLKITLKYLAASRKKFNDVARESEDLFRSSFDSAPVGKALVGLDGRLLKVNKALAELSGCDEHQLSSLKVQDIFQPDPGGTVSEFDENFLLDEKRACQMEGRCRHGLGNERFVLLNFSSASDARHLPRHFILQVLDITTRKQAELSLRESEKRYRKLVEATTSYIYTVDIADGVPKATRHEPGCVYVTGYTSEEYDRNPNLWYQMVYEPDRTDVIHQANAILAGKTTAPLEHRIVHKDGSIRWVRNSPVPHYDDQGRLIACDGLITNITAERGLKDQLHQAQKMEAVGQLAGGIAHDFNNILTTIIGYCTILTMKMTGDSPLKQDVDHILNAAERAAKLTERLLSFSRKKSINPVSVNINDIVQGVDKLISRVIGEDVRVRYSLCTEGLTTVADSWQIEQALINLATNARDAMPKGGFFTIETGTADLDEEFIKTHGYGEVGTYATITVADTGTGMDEATQKRIFEPFFTTKDVGKGTGLGLAIVYGIVKQHRGYITVASEPGKGTIFKIYLPVVHGTVAETKPAQTAHAAGKETVLLAEDDPDVRCSTKALLENYGYTVIEAEGGEEAINKFKSHRNSVDLLILDVVMPTKTGREVYEEIRKINPDIKALFTSGYTDDLIRDRGILEKDSHFVSKPIAPAQFSRKIREVLDA
jgi:PAS domain S-box-containing protein